MWIRSQDKQCLVNCICDDVNYLSVDEFDICYGKIGDMYIILGTYSTKEKALKVFNNIHKRIITIEMTTRGFRPIINDGELLVFEMPLDEEVNV